MLQQLMKDLKLHKGRFAILVVLPILFLLGFGMVCLVMFTEEDPGSWVTMGTFLALGMLVVAAAVMGLSYRQEFMLALSMGRTRGAFMVSYAARMALWMAVGYAMVLALYRLELALGQKLFAPWPMEVDPTFLLDWRLIVGVIAGAVLLSMFVGALYSSFGKKALVPMYFGWMALCILGPQLAHTEGEEASPIGQAGQALLQAVPGGVWIALGIALLAGMAATVVVLGKKQMVQ